MRLIRIGQVLFAASFAGLGVLGIMAHEFAFVWQLVPAAFPWRDTLTLVCGVILIVSSVGLFVPRVARAGALVLALVLIVFELLFRLPGVVAHPLSEGEWYGLCETLVFVAGGWTIFSLLPARDGGALSRFGSVRAGQILFGLALPAIGLSHFVYVNLTAPLIPSWLPFHMALAWFTGAAHIAAGLAILSGILSRLGATLEAVMVSLFTLLIWVPTVAAAPTNAYNWSELLVSLAISGVAWSLAGSFTRTTARTT